MKTQRVAIWLAWIVPLLAGAAVYLFRPRFMMVLVEHPVSWLALLAFGGLLSLLPGRKRRNGQT